MKIKWHYGQWNPNFHNPSKDKPVLFYNPQEKDFNVFPSYECLYHTFPSLKEESLSGDTLSRNIFYTGDYHRFWKIQGGRFYTIWCHVDDDAFDYYLKLTKNELSSYYQSAIKYLESCNLNNKRINKIYQGLSNTIHST